MKTAFQQMTPKKPLSPKFCVHYRSLVDHDTCKAGVRYDSFHGTKFPDRPCMFRNANSDVKCEHREWPTQEALQAEEDENEACIAQVMKVLPIVGKIKKKHKGKNWKGTRPCPVCADGILTIVHAACNGHCAVGCSTPDCVSFRE